MFVCVARCSLALQEISSLKARRTLVRRVTDRLKARFNAAVAEVDPTPNLIVIGLALVGPTRAHVADQMDEVFRYLENMYIAPVVKREVETISFGEDFFGDSLDAVVARTNSNRSLAEVEGLGAWETRHAREPHHPVGQVAEAPKTRRTSMVSLADARERARRLRNRREWEDE